MTSTASHSATPPHGRRLPGNHGGAPGGALRPAPEPEGALPGGASPEGTLPAGAGPWAVRVVDPGRGRAALELYQHGELADVLVDARLTPQLLRGARRSAAAGRGRHVLAWGRLAADGTAPSVVFTGRWSLRPSRSGLVAQVVTVAGRFWLAWAEGSFRAVLVEHPAGGPAERLPLERVREREWGQERRVGGAA
ncbi:MULTISPECIES: hypothetical protein [Streptomyces]|uniref:hypothetical protein n=1 Tax=Streptomyces TaxID=1883 RepID=UPI0004BFA884|nr:MULTISPECIES: hypothetical protein [Streptomyces]